MALGLLDEQQFQQVVEVVLASVLALPLVAFFGFQVEVGLASNPAISRAVAVVDQTRLGSQPINCIVEPIRPIQE